MLRSKYEGIIEKLNVGESTSLSLTFDHDSYYLVDDSHPRSIVNQHPAKSFDIETQIHYRRILITRTA